MTLTPEQIQLVQDTFAKVAPIADVAADIFYTRLFEVAPHYRPMFKHDMKEQGKKLMDVMAIAVRSLTRLDMIVPAVQALGARHVKYGIMPEDYDVVGGVLLWTLEKGLGADFTPEAREAWAATYDILAKTAIGENYPVMA